MRREVVMKIERQAKGRTVIQTDESIMVETSDLEEEAAVNDCSALT